MVSECQFIRSRVSRYRKKCQYINTLDFYLNTVICCADPPNNEASYDLMTINCFIALPHWHSNKTFQHSTVEIIGYADESETIISWCNQAERSNFSGRLRCLFMDNMIPRYVSRRSEACSQICSLPESCGDSRWRLETFDTLTWSTFSIQLFHSTQLRRL